MHAGYAKETQKRYLNQSRVRRSFLEKSFVKLSFKGLVAEKTVVC